MIPKCYDCLFVYLREYLFLKLLNKCEYVIVGAVLSEHGKKCDIAIFCHCHTQSVISVNETVENKLVFYAQSTGTQLKVALL